MYRKPIIADQRCRAAKLAVLASALVLLLGACVPASRDRLDADRPMSFHDTRLQYALLTDDAASLKGDFKMSSDTSPAARVVAGLVLPFSAATEVAFWPLSQTLQALGGARP